MPPNEISTKIEPEIAEQADSAQAEKAGAERSFYKELANSVVFAAIEQPALGVAQFISNDAMNSVKKAFSRVGIEAPEAAQFNSANWYAQTFGGAVGMIAPFALTKVGLGKLGTFGKAASAETGYLSRRAAVGLSLKESAITGGVYGAAFTPSEESARSAGFASFLKDRTISGVGSAATFTALTAGSLGVGRLAETAAATRFGVAPFLSNRIVSGALGGLPGGLVAAEYDAVARQGRLATAHELTESMYAMAVVGGTFAGATYFPKINRIGANTREQANREVNTDAGANRVVAGENGVVLKVVPNVTTTEVARGATTAESTRTIESTRTAESATVAESTKLAESAKLAESTASRNAGAVVEAPTHINPHEFKQHGNFDKTARLELAPGEQAIWRDIQKARTSEEWQKVSERIDELPTDKRVWFGETLDRHGKSLTDAELSGLWPRLLQEDPHQGYRIAKHVGHERTTKVWQEQLESVQKTPNPRLAEELAKTMVFVEPGKQLQGLNDLLNLEKPPSYLDMASVTLAKENQMPAAKMLAERGITPQIETGHIAASAWADWTLTLEPGKIRDGLLDQVRRKIRGSTKNPAEELNEVYKVAQDRVGPKEYEMFNSMLTGITPEHGGASGIAIRTTALKDIDPKFINRMSFFERDWHMSDQIALQNPELIRSLAINSRFNPNLDRSAYIAEIMSRRPPVTAEELSNSILAKGRQADEQQRQVFLSPGDVKAMVEQGVKVAPEQVPQLLHTLRSDVLHSLDLHGNKPIHRSRLLLSLTLAQSIGKANPKAFESEFTGPIESALADSNLHYGRRLEASKAVGELQRAGFESAAAIQMPELRMGKLAELSIPEQAAMRQSIEKALFNKESLKAMLGQGPLGRLMPSVFGEAAEGGIVGRRQHQTHDFTLDRHLLEVVERASKDPEFAKLLPKDQENLLWASLLHDVGKKENMVDFDHNRTSTSMAWGILRTLGYSDARIQRITDVMSKDAELSFNPDHRNSAKLANPKEMDNVVNSYRNPDALNMVAILNRADIKSVKAEEAWFTPEVIAELDKIQTPARARVEELNKHLLPVLPSEFAKGYGGHQMSEYSAYGHSPYNFEQFLKQRPTIESPEYSMSVSLFTPGNHRVYSEGSQVVALINGPFEHIAQANRANLSTGTSVGWDGHVKLVEQWSTDHRAKALATEAEQRLAQIGIPPARDVAPENFPRLNQLRKVSSQFESHQELVAAAGKSDKYVQASEAITQMLTAERDGAPLKTNNEIKLNNPIVSGIGLLRNGNQKVFFEGLSPKELQEMWKGNVPDFVSSGPSGTAPSGALVVGRDVAVSAKSHNLPVVILNDRIGGSQ